AQLATENTIDPRTKATGGKLDNWVPLNQLQGELGTAIAAAQPGQVVGPFEMGPGAVALLKIDETRSQTPIDEVRDQIKAELEKELTQKAIEDARTNATIIREGEAAPGAVVTPPGAPAPANPTPAAPAPSGGQ
ncbi:MAG: peptidylprolyl isomerase, partial [Myxococcota bacterium]